MASLIAISGSLRKASFNTQLMHEVVRLAPAGVTVETATLHGIPLYDGDVEAASGIPEAVKRLQDRIAAATGVILVTPEYNNSIPGVFKNAIDWISRPPTEIKRVFADRPVALMGTTPGRGGTGLAQLAWLQVLRTLGMRPFFHSRLELREAGNAFDGEGHFKDAKTAQQVADFISAFSDFATR